MREVGGSSRIEKRIGNRWEKNEAGRLTASPLPRPFFFLLRKKGSSKGQLAAASLPVRILREWQ